MGVNKVIQEIYLILSLKMSQVVYDLDESDLQIQEMTEAEIKTFKKNQKQQSKQKGK